MVFCLFFLRFGITFETDDDWFLMTRIQGVFKQSTPFLIFSNIFYGYALLFLYKIIPQINWYIAIQLFFLYLAVCQLSIVLLANKRKNDIIIILAFLFIINLIKEIFFAFQFTKTASITIIAGYAWLYNGVSHEKSIKYTLWGVVTLCFGALVRFDCLFLVIPAIGLIIIYDFFVIHECGKRKKKLLCRKVSLLFFTTLLCSFLPFCEKLYVWHHDKYAEFMSYNGERAKFNDYPHLSYNENKVFFESHGISENDFLMLERRNDIDGFYTKELISIINSVSYPKKNFKIIFQSLSDFFSAF